MKPHISVLFRGVKRGGKIWAGAAVAWFLASCGQQDPAFTEQASTIAAGDPAHVDTSDATAIDTKSQTTPGTNSNQISGQKNPLVYTSYRPGDPIAPGSEDFTGLSLVSDTSIQRNSSKVDILWVVDSSGSMRPEQTYLGQNFSSFINQLVGGSSDFQVGITTSDVCDNANPSTIPSSIRYCPVNAGGDSSTHLRGSLVGQTGKKVLSRSTVDLSSRFSSYANVGINGSSFEHGLTAAKMAIEKSVNGQNEGLVRNDAFLAVIVVSDEEDDGIGLGMRDSYSGDNYIQMGLTSYRYTSDDFVRDALALKGPGQFSVSAITGTRLANGSMCTSPHAQPLEEGTQYINAAKKTGGTIQSICDTNWSTTLANIGQDIGSQSSQIVLSKRPYASSIIVTINGSPSLNWSYNGGNNAVKFDNGSVPPVGASIKISYYPAP